MAKIILSSVVEGTTGLPNRLAQWSKAYGARSVVKGATGLSHDFPIQLKGRLFYKIKLKRLLFITTNLFVE